MNDSVYREAKTLILQACNYFAIADAWENYTNVVSIMQSACDSSTSAIPILWRLESQKNPCVQIDFGSSCLRSTLVKVACLRATVLLVLLYSIMFYYVLFVLLGCCNSSSLHFLSWEPATRTCTICYYLVLVVRRIFWSIRAEVKQLWPDTMPRVGVFSLSARSQQRLRRTWWNQRPGCWTVQISCNWTVCFCMFLLISEFCVVIAVFQGCGVSAWSRSTRQHWSGRRWGNKPSALDSDLKWAPNPPFPSVSSRFGFQQKQRCLCVWNQNAGVQSPYCSDQLKCQHCWNSESSAQNILCGTSYIRTAPCFPCFPCFPMFVPWFSRRLRFAKANGAESQAPHRCAGADRGTASLLPKEQDGHWDLQKSGAAHDCWGLPFSKETYW